MLLCNSLADLVIFSTTKNSDVRSANNFALDAKSSDKEFIYIRKSNGLSIEHCGTLLQLLLMTSIARLEQLFAFAEIRNLLQYLIIYLICPFL